MKQKRLLLVVLTLTMMLPVMAQKKQRTDPDHAMYSITGTMKVNNGKRLLEGASGKHISFEYFDSRWAKPTDMADLVVRFDSVRTDPYHPMTKLDFWRYDEEIGEWIYDSEVRQGEEQMESTMKTNIMLVIDNSRSLEGDFKKVQDAAIEFVQQLYHASQGKDIFRVGVIGFSTVKFTRTLDIMPLDNTNYRKIVSFIRGLEMQNGTAFYYSLETALNMLESDAQKNIALDEYKESRIYAFTDGLDQASVDDSRNLTTPTEYYDHLRPLMKGSQRKRIMDMPRKIVFSTIVTVRGGDMTDGQERQFDQRANEICDNVRKLKDISQLVSEFQQLAKDLVNSNKVLYCYIPVGANGRVGWTFAENIVRTPVKSSIWIGAGFEGVSGWYYGGYEDYYGYWHGDWYRYFSLGLRLDIIAFPISRWFGFGATVSLSTAEDEFLWEGGALTKFTFPNSSSLLIGAGARWGFDQIYPYATVGWKFKSPWYIFANIYTDEEVDDILGFGFGVGYSIVGGK